MTWHIGNTTVRTPYRLKYALTALQGTSLNGNLHGNENENAFAHLLHDEEVLNILRVDEDPEADVSDLGRKWRSALSQLGFITHKVNTDVLIAAAHQITGLSGRSFEITPNGYRLINSEPATAQQECFLRSLLAYKIPSVIEPRYDCTPFCPLQFVINILIALENKGATGNLSFEEFALFVQTNTPDSGIEEIADEIIAYRTRREQATGQVRQFLKQEYRNAVLREDPNIEEGKIKQKEETLEGYADLTLRYLKATGLFRSLGHGIILNDAKRELASIISTTALDNPSQVDYLVSLWNGAALPTDNVDTAELIFADLIRQIREKGREVEPFPADADVNLKRHILEQQLVHIAEEEYYRLQASQTEEIGAWLYALQGNRVHLPDGTYLSVPKGEAPAYFEWAIWRAFLAINSLVNKPWEARRFQIDQDFLPINTAPGNGPDMVFEFEDAIVVVEVTLTTSSRQEAAEGEPVRRHVAKYVESQAVHGKPVYGLFLAVNIDSNTAHTFRTGDWYLKDDSKANLHIVPIRLDDFTALFKYGSDKLEQMPGILKSVIQSCRMEATQDAPQWKKTISNIVQRTIN